MSKKDSGITATDQFAGCGGSTSGAKEAGVKVKLALNHWGLAIETHNTNHPETDHDCTDISACDPRRYHSTTILITSPECTNHSLAKGKKVVKKQLDMYATGKLDPAAERSRATMWDVPRFAEVHKYESIITENVVDLRKWVMYDSWIHAMHSLGYSHKAVYINSMHMLPTPQSRDRMYVVFWKKGNKAPDLEFMPEAYCQKCQKNVLAVQSWKKEQKTWKYKTGYLFCCPSCSKVVEPYYYAAFNCIDWTDPGTRIGDRKKALSPKTLIRAQYGLDKYGDDPLIIATRYTSGISDRVKSAIESPIGTQPTDVSHAVCVPYIIKLEHNNGPRSVTEEMAAQTTTQGMGFITVSQGTSKIKEIIDPLNAVTAGGVKSGIVTDASWNSFIAAYQGGSNCTKHIYESMGTITAGDRMSLVKYQKPNLDDCYYRMLKPREIQAAMAFNKNYVVLGNSRDKVKQLGNAVTPPVMKWLTGRVVDALR